MIKAMKNIKIKVCGMKFPENIAALRNLDIDFIGFNFYERSLRYIGDMDHVITAKIPSNIKKVGVFVNSDIDTILELQNYYGLDYVQLHGDETPDFCNELFSQKILIIKAFQIDEKFNFNILNEFEKYCSYFLFDNKSNTYGGSGKKFSWDILKNTNSKKEYFLSGGIDISDTTVINSFKDKGINVFGVDINSKFEIEPGRKDIIKISDFINKLKTN